MEHVSSVRPTGKFPEKVENLKRWARFPSWSFRTEFRVQFTSFSYSHSLYQFQVHGRAPRLTGVYDQMEQLFINRKFHFCSHRNFQVLFLNGKRPTIQLQFTAISEVFRATLFETPTCSSSFVCSGSGSFKYKFVSLCFHFSLPKK